VELHLCSLEELFLSGLIVGVGVDLGGLGGILELCMVGVDSWSWSRPRRTRRNSGALYGRG